MSRQPLVAVAGATGTGKSDASIAIAEALDGEVVGADAYQLYRGLDIGTAKVDAATRARVPHHPPGQATFLGQPTRRLLQSSGQWKDFHDARARARPVHRAAEHHPRQTWRAVLCSAPRPRVNVCGRPGAFCSVRSRAAVQTP